MPKYDIIFIMPAPFTDHPSFPEALLKRSLEAEGFSVGVIETPFWQESQSFTALGKPALFYAIVPGPVDSIVLNYTSSRKRRKEDLYQADGNAYFPGYPPSIKYKIRPDRTILAFANRIKQVDKETPIIIGGIEASMRRFVHYDFQEEQLRRSILLDSRAHILVNGRGEKQICRIAGELKKGVPISAIDIPGITRVGSEPAHKNRFIELPSHEDIQQDVTNLMKAQLLLESTAGKGVFQRHGSRAVIQNPPEIYTSQDLDRVYSMPFSRTHPGLATVSQALDMNMFSVTSHWGCAGRCSFCALTLHGGGRVISRSQESIIDEIRSLTGHKRWKGVISDIGGASAEMYGMDRQKKEEIPLQPFRELLEEARKLPEIKNVFLGSGIRYDLALKNPGLLEDIMRFHSGRFLRVAPEHSEDHILRLVKKPEFNKFIEFCDLFNAINRGLKRKIELGVYIIVGHPGETRSDVFHMRSKLRELGIHSVDAQIFTPTPGTLSTAMYVCGQSPKGEPLPVERNVKELLARKALLYNK